MHTKYYLLLTILCASTCLQASQVARKKAVKNKKHATPLEFEMIADADNGRLTEKTLQRYLSYFS